MSEWRSTVSAVSRALAIVDYLATSKTGCTISEMHEALSIEISIVSRLVSTLESDGFVRKLPGSERYVLSLRLAGIVYKQLSRFNLESVCAPELQRLAEEVRELVQLSVVDGDAVRFIAKAEVEQRVVLQGLLGHTAQPDAMATGKAWLAWLADEEQSRIIATAQGDVPVRGRPDLPSLFRDLEEVRTRGYAIEIEANTEEVAAVAAPIWAGPPNVVVGVVTISGPAYRLGAQRLSEMAPALLSTAEELGKIWPAVLLLQQTASAARHRPFRAGIAS